MLITDLELFKTQQQELHRRAAYYRLLKSLQESPPVLARISSTIGSALILLGQEMVRRAQAAH